MCCGKRPGPADGNAGDGVIFSLPFTVYGRLDAYDMQRKKGYDINVPTKYHLPVNTIFKLVCYFHPLAKSAGVAFKRSLRCVPRG